MQQTNPLAKLYGFRSKITSIWDEKYCKHHFGVIFLQSYEAILLS